MPGDTQAPEILMDDQITDDLISEMSVAVRNAMPGISRIDSEGCYTSVNHEYAAMTEYQPNELKGQSWERFLMPEDLPIACKAMQEMLDDGSADFEARSLRKDGSVFYQHTMIVKRADLQGEYAGFLCLMRDTTDRKVTESALQESLEMWRALAQGVGEHVGIADKDMCICFVNRFIGDLPLEQVIGTTLFDWIEEEYHEQLAECGRRVFETSETQSLEFEGYGANGALCWYAARIGPLKEGGRVVAFAIAFTDITQRKKNQEQVRRYEFIANASHDLMTLIGRDYTIEAANDAYCRTHNKNREEIVGHALPDIWGNETFANHIRPNIDRCLAGESVKYDQWFEFGTLGNGYFEVNLFPYRNPENEITHVAVVTHNITECKQTVEKLQQAMKELKETQATIVEQERLRAVGVMASGIAHDFNNALSSILGFSELLLETPEDLDDREKVIRYLGFINTEARDAAKVVSRLSDFYRDRNQDEVFVPVDLNRVVEQAIPLTQPMWRDQALARGQTIELHTSLVDVPMVPGNDSALREALTNLILNAVEAVRTEGRIELRTGTRGNWAFVEVNDNGIGMTDDIRQRCLDPFFTSKGPEGSGLGLPMVYGIIQRHFGELEIESEIGRGASIRLLLPRDENQNGYSVEKPQSKKAKPRRILLAEDELSVRTVTTEQLTSDGHEVVAAENGSAALSLFDKSDFDLVITDLAMPGMAGDKLADHIKEKKPEMKIILLTGFGDLLAAVNDQPDSVDLVLNKPVSRAELRQALEQIEKNDIPAEPV